MRMCSALIEIALSMSKRAGFAFTSRTSNFSTISSIEKMSRSGAIDQPSSAGRIEQALLDEAVLAVQEQIRLRVSLGKLLVALTHHVRQVAEQRHLLGNAEFHKVAVEHDLARGGAEQVLAAQHDVDAHERVVHGVRERVQRVAVRAHDHVIRHRTGLERDLTANEIVEGDVFVGHLDAQCRLAALRAERCFLLLAQIAVVAVVAERLRAPCRFVARLNLLRRGYDSYA